MASAALLSVNSALRDVQSSIRTQSNHKALRPVLAFHVLTQQSLKLQSLSPFVFLFAMNDDHSFIGVRVTIEDCKLLAEALTVNLMVEKLLWVKWHLWHIPLIWIVWTTKLFVRVWGFTLLIVVSLRCCSYAILDWLLCYSCCTPVNVDPSKENRCWFVALHALFRVTVFVCWFKHTSHTVVAQNAKQRNWWCWRKGNRRGP